MQDGSEGRMGNLLLQPRLEVRLCKMQCFYTAAAERIRYLLIRCLRRPPRFPHEPQR
jgi:hypothetical protein